MTQLTPAPNPDSGPEESPPVESAPTASPRLGPGPEEQAPSGQEGASSETLSPLDEPWGRAARSVGLAALLGLALVAWVQLSFFAPWLTEYLTKNALPMPTRMLFLGTIFGGAGLGAAIAGALAWRARLGAPALAELERWLWFLSPLILLPALPLFFHADAWKSRHEELLPAVLLTGLVCEVLIFQSLRNVPAPAGEALRLLREDLQKRTRPWLARHGWTVLIACACLGYGLFMSFYTIRWHHKLGTAIFDLGINNNLIHGGLEGVFNQSTVIFPENPIKYFANHVKLGLYLFLPIYALVPRAETLLVIQSFALGLGALPLFLFARRRLPEWTAAVIALCYLLYYPMHSANFYEMKEVPIASVFLLTTIWAADARRWKICAVAFFCTLIMREDTPPGLAVLGVFLLLSGHRPRAGAIMAAIATSWFVFLRFYLMEEAGDWWFPNMYEDLWSPGERGFRSVLKTLVSNPYYTLTHVIVEKKVYYLLHLLVPVMFVPARRWYLWAAFIPGAIITLLVTDYDPPIMFTFQYVMYWAPFLFVAVVIFLAEVAKRADFGRQRAQAALVAVALASLTLSFNYGAFAAREKSFRSGYHTISFTFSDEERQRYADLRALISHLPPKASVTATERIGAHVSDRRLFYSMRRGTHGADYLIARKSELRLDRTRVVLQAALERGEYGVLQRVGEFVLFKKGHETSGNQAVLDEWGLVKRKPKSRKKKQVDKAEEAGDKDQASKDTDDADDTAADAMKPQTNEPDTVTDDAAADDE
ncbi:MAG: DUF2079 domain-containing protein [Myxococcales bacterium]|jgi:uncharacterized membrane protein|nr:DUF2079 domain-containing protein [Myxococcales bacterium]